MNNKLFSLLIALMTLSLLGIIFVQGYWIKNSYQNREDQFTLNIRQVLISVSKEIQLEEIEKYYNVYNSIIDTIQVSDQASFSELIYSITNERNDEIYIFSDGVLEENYKLSSSALNLDMDSIQFKKITSRKVTTKITSGIDGNKNVQTKTESFKRLKDYEQNQFENAYKNILSKTPIHKRTSGEKIKKLIIKQLEELGLSTNFEYAVYSNSLATKIRSRNFTLDPTSTYGVPLFVNDDIKTNFQLYVNFSDKENFVLNSIMGMAILSLLFTGVIILTYTSALRQLLKQRQISQIKTDFINNMTHEFKTPIATINLALDALKNPKVSDNKEFIARYHNMIREENQRMHTQVENVLRISKLENDELDLEKGEVNLHYIIEDAITHVSLIVENKGGYIKTHLNALNSSVYGSDIHLTNIIVNIIDNAIKYTEVAPEIDIYTENEGNNIILKIVDKGIGMSKVVQNKIFEKFYREQMGNIHNVKGHGLGLSYVKRILDDHNAGINVDSEKGKGSTFSIKIHLIS
ncbi:MAG: HAMP domain-containing histidine kinase [Flavobacteriaceae bacterium]|jgi:two-component system phosphate regulon sensor histidine kinase PhoR|nr:HAMP domain-containing histidine kinase [Flavobacteriaceae bacterium]MBT6705540.1 HAMP domain-containing histidine kinase [Flavobacteriaceae bacterium]|tara:strand:+ start:50 stop:1612 length:1563 start_codon:yes stop_codon:yes gene_type:complete